MSRTYFYGSEEKVRQRLLVLQEFVGTQPLHDKPCKLLAAQLNELGVICSKMQATLRELAKAVDEAAAEGDTDAQ